MSEDVKKPVYKKWWFWVGIIAVIGIVAGTSGKKSDGAIANAETSSTTTEKPVEAPKEVPAMVVSAKQLYADYESNELSADGKYKGKKLEVTGEVDGVTKNFGVVRVNLKADEFIKSVSCKMKNESDAASLAKGSTVTLVGLGDGKTLMPELEDCTVKK